MPRPIHPPEIAKYWNPTTLRYEIPPELLIPDPDNPRGSEEEIRDLEGKDLDKYAVELATQDIQTYVTVRTEDGKIYVVSGARRSIASQRTNDKGFARANDIEPIRAVPCVLQPGNKISRAELIRSQFSVNETAKPLPPCNLGRSLLVWMEDTGTKKRGDVAVEFGKPLKWVNDHIALTTLSKAVQREVNIGRIPLKTGVDLSAFADDVERQEELASDFIAKDKSALEIEILALRKLGKAPARKKHGTRRKIPVKSGIVVIVRHATKRLSFSDISAAFEQAMAQLRADEETADDPEE